MTESIEGMQVLHDTKANLVSTSTVLKEGEFFHETDTDRVRIGDGTTQGKNRPVMLDSNHEAYIAGIDRKYAGKDLTSVHATEIASGKTRNNTAFTAGDAWGWIKKRIADNDFDGIHVGDYIPFNLSAGSISDGTTTYSISAKTMQAQIVGIDTYYNYGYPSAEGHHIDFISKQTVGTNMKWNPTDNNNGTSVDNYPFTASAIYACLNGVNNYTTSAYNSVAHGFDASSGGILQLLPSALQSVIKMKRLFTEKRYSGSGLLTEANAGDITDIGKLWLPTEVEVYGFPCNSQQKDGNGVNRSANGSIQYPFFANCHSKDKNRVNWWLSSVASGTSSRACNVNNNGNANTNECTNTNVSAPV